MNNNEQQLREWFEANYLDGDKIQEGQVISSAECFEALKAYRQKMIEEIENRIPIGDYMYDRNEVLDIIKNKE